MPRYVEIAVNVPHVKEVFHYHVPQEIDDQIQVGHLVEVPFGGQRVQGVILRFIETPSVKETRPLLSLIDLQPIINTTQIHLAEHLARNSLNPLPVWINLMLPTGLSQQSDTLYQLREPPVSISVDAKLSKQQQRLLKLLTERGPLRGRQIDQAFPRINWRSHARSLVQRNILEAQPVLPGPRVQPKITRMVELAVSNHKILESIPHLGKAGSQAGKRRQMILEFLMKENHPTNVSWLYATSGGKSGDIKKLVELGLVQVVESETLRDPLLNQEFSLTIPPVLTKDQQICWKEIKESIQDADRGNPGMPILLHGVTGSGKTELYLRAVEETLSFKKQAIVLVPEIALTPQTTRRFLSRFPGKVGLIHSRLSAGERYDTWRRARSGQIELVIGPRSALFTPFPNPGLIVIDECHDDSYYQNDPPFYDARWVSVEYARLIKGICIMGSATPDISQNYQAKTNRWKYLKLPNRILAHREAVENQVAHWQIGSSYQVFENEAMTIDLPAVSIVDMRQELKAGNRSIFSRSLRNSLTYVIDHNQQAILFLNRRGTATYVFCRDCGYTVKCPNCKLPLTYHLQPQKSPSNQDMKSKLICHHCGYQRLLPSKCPACGSPHIRQFGTGTERVETEVQALFPSVRTLRWDFETTRHKGAHDLILNNFLAHRADVLIGTQMLAKGLDLPLVTLVGVVLTDVGLNLPDYRAAERTFQVLTQVAGRAGRSPLGGSVIFQTFQPDHYVIQAAANHDYQRFYQQEIAYRKQLAYPPFKKMLRLEYRHTDAHEAETKAHKMGEQIRQWIEKENMVGTQVTGPVPCFYAHLAGYYRWHIILRGPDPAQLLHDRVFEDWRVELDPPSFL